MNKKEIYIKIKTDKKMCIVFEKNGAFYKVYNRDALIMWYLYKYNIMGNIVSFPISACRKIIFDLNKKGISVVVIGDKVKKYEVIDNNYFQYLLSAYKELEINKAYELNELTRDKVKLDIGNYEKIKDFI